jgi:hypothetical protein
MPSVAEVRTALHTALVAIDGSGDYTLDLSGSLIKGAAPTALPSVQGGLAYLWRGRGRWPRADAPVSDREVAVEWNLVIYDGPGASADDREDWLDAAERDVVAALDLGLGTGGALLTAGVQDIPEIEAVPFLGSQPNAGDVAGIWVRLTTVHDAETY